MNELLLKDQNFSTNITKAKEKLNGFKQAADSVSLDKMKSQVNDGKSALNDLGISSNSVTSVLGKLGINVNSVLGTIGKLAPVVAVATAAFSTYKEMVAHNTTMADDYDRVQKQVNATVNAFWTTLANGNFANFISGLEQIAQKAAEARDRVDDLAVAKFYLDPANRKLQAQFDKQMAIARNTSNSKQQRTEALNQAKVIQGQLEKNGKTIADKTGKEVSTAINSFMAQGGYNWTLTKEEQQYYANPQNGLDIEKDAATYQRIERERDAAYSATKTKKEQDAAKAKLKKDIEALVGNELNWSSSKYARANAFQSQRGTEEGGKALQDIYNNQQAVEDNSTKLEMNTRMMGQTYNRINKPEKTGTGTSGKGGKGGSNTPQATATSLTALEKQLSNLQKNYRDGLLPNLTADKYIEQVTALEKEIKEKKIEMGIDLPDESIEELRKKFLKLKEDWNIGLHPEMSKEELDATLARIQAQINGKSLKANIKINPLVDYAESNKKMMEQSQSESDEGEVKFTSSERMSNYRTSASKYASQYKTAVQGGDSDSANAAKQKLDDYISKYNELSDLIGRGDEFHIKLDATGNIVDGTAQRATDKYMEGMQGINSLGGEVSNAMNGVASAIKVFDDEDASGLDKFAAGFQMINQLANSTIGIIQTVQTITQAFSEANAAASQKNAAAAQMETGANVGKAVSSAGAAMGEAAASGASLPFPANIAAIAAGVAAVTAVIATIFSIIGSFHNGGIVGSFADGGTITGSSAVNDHLLAKVNAGEMILNQSQQAKLWKVINDGSVHGSSLLSGGEVEFKIKGSTLVGAQKNYYKKESRL